MQTPTNDASPPQDLLAALSQKFTSVTPEMLELIKLIGRDAHASADAETGDLVRSILNAAGASGRNAPSPAPAVPTSLVTAKTEPVVASRSGGMGPPLTRASSTSDVEAKIRRVSAGKGKENEQASDVSMSAPTSSGSKKRKAKSEKVESCENCGATETSHWRKKTGSGMVCNGESLSRASLPLLCQQKLTLSLSPLKQLAVSTGTASRASGLESFGTSPSRP